METPCGTCHTGAEPASVGDVTFLHNRGVLCRISALAPPPRTFGLCRRVHARTLHTSPSRPLPCIGRSKERRQDLPYSHYSDYNINLSFDLIVINCIASFLEIALSIRLASIRIP